MVAQHNKNVDIPSGDTVPLELCGADKCPVSQHIILLRDVQQCMSALWHCYFCIKSNQSSRWCPYFIRAMKRDLSFMRLWCMRRRTKYTVLFVRAGKFGCVMKSCRWRAPQWANRPDLQNTIMVNTIPFLAVRRKRQQSSIAWMAAAAHDLARCQGGSPEWETAEQWSL